MYKYVLKRRSDDSVFDRASNKKQAIRLVEYYEKHENVECYFEEEK